MSTKHVGFDSCSNIIATRSLPGCELRLINLKLSTELVWLLFFVVSQLPASIPVFGMFLDISQAVFSQVVLDNAR